MTWNEKPPPRPSRRAVLGLLGAASIAGPLGGPLAVPAEASASAAGTDPELAARIAEIIHRPAFAGSTWGMAFSAPDTGEIVYA